MLALAAAFQSCSDKKADAQDLLKTVPSDASLVAVANVHSLLEKAGCKVDGSEIESGQAIGNLIGGISDERVKKLATAFYNGDSGVDPSVALIFTEGYYTYVTGIVTDPTLFKKTVEETLGVKFIDKEGVETASTVALLENRFWINVNQSDIDPKEVKHFTSLSDDQSFLSKDISKQLAEFEKDIVGWGSINGMLNTSGLNFQQRAPIQVAFQTLFEDASDFIFNVDFLKGKAEIDAKVINSKGKAAKFLFAADKIDIETVKKISGTGADAYGAIAVPSKLIKQIQKDAKDKGPSVIGMFVGMLTNVDGTMAFATSKDGMKGVITTNGESTTELTTELTRFGYTVSKEGKLIMLTQGTVAGQLKGDAVAEDFKGALAGAVINLKEGQFSPKQTPNQKVTLDKCVFRLIPSDGGINFKIEIYSTDSKENFLLSAIEAAN